MGLDAKLRRFFPAVALVLVGIAAYFQASGLAHLLGSGLLDDPSSVPVALSPGRPLSPVQAPGDHATSGADILSRNPFDSQTDLLHREGEEPAPVPVEDTGTLGDGPLCDGVQTILITHSDDPSWSFAALAGKDGRRTLRRIGDALDDRTVQGIDWDTVWLTSSSGQRCRSVIGQKAPPSAPVAAPRADSVRREQTSTKRGSLPVDIASGIHKISDTRVEVERSVVDKIMEKQGELFRSVRITPPGPGGKGGLGISGVRPGSLLDALGLQSGDSLVSVNGFEMTTDPQKGLEAFMRLRSADRLDVSIVRGGKPVAMEVHIR